LEAIDPALLEEVRAYINEEMECHDPIAFCSKHDSMIHKHTSIKKDHEQKMVKKYVTKITHLKPIITQPLPTRVGLNLSSLLGPPI